MKRLPASQMTPKQIKVESARRKKVTHKRMGDLLHKAQMDANNCLDTAIIYHNYKDQKLAEKNLRKASEKLDEAWKHYMFLT